MTYTINKQCRLCKFERSDMCGDSECCLGKNQHNEDCKHFEKDYMIEFKFSRGTVNEIKHKNKHNL